MSETTKQKHKYIERGAKVGDTLGWLGVWLPLPLFILVSIIFAGIGVGIGFLTHLAKKRA